MHTCGFITLSERQMYEINKIFEEFDKNNIDYMPLKGTLLKKMYPKTEMRVMSDADILIKTEQYDTIKSVMENLGYTYVLESDHEFVWSKRGISIELHKRLIPSYNEDYYAYYGDGWRLGRPVFEGGNRYAMSADDEMVYLFTHFAKHYRDAGIGIKHIVDLWVYKNAVKSLDNQYILDELKKLQLSEFYKNIMLTLECWFGKSEFDEKTYFITDTIFNNGVYGKHTNHVITSALKTSKLKESAQKVRFIKFKNMLFLPYDKMCTKYPVLTKIPFLLPIMWVVRGFNVIIFKRNQMKTFENDVKSISNKKIDERQLALSFVGLDFNFND